MVSLRQQNETTGFAETNTKVWRTWFAGETSQTLHTSHRQTAQRLIEGHRVTQVKHWAQIR